MSEMLLKHNLKTLRLPTMLSEYAQLSREAADQNENYEQYLLRLTELEVATRSANALAARIKNAGFPVLKDLETYDFAAMPSLSKQKILELARGQWIEESLVFEAQSAVEVLFVAGDGIEVEERFIHAAVLDHLDAGQLLVAERRNPRGRPIGHANRGAEG